MNSSKTYLCFEFKLISIDVKLYNNYFCNIYVIKPKLSSMDLIILKNYNLVSYSIVEQLMGTYIANVGDTCYRFSAFWLRSKCSICSYQLNIWYVGHWSTSILNWFLKLDGELGACSTSVTGWLGIAVPPRTAHHPLWVQQIK